MDKKNSIHVGTIQKQDSKQCPKKKNINVRGNKKKIIAIDDKNESTSPLAETIRIHVMLRK